jgi:prephenate dehydrogenase
MMTPELHDAMVSRTSHLPHVVAAALARAVLAPHFPPEQALLCAKGFRDTTRIASGSVEMWRDICLANREPLGMAVDELLADLGKFREALGSGNDSAIEAFLEQAKGYRDKWRMEPGATSRDFDG